MAVVGPTIGRIWGKGRARKQNHVRGGNAGEGRRAADTKVAKVKTRPDGLAERPKVI